MWVKTLILALISVKYGLKHCNLPQNKAKSTDLEVISPKIEAILLDQGKSFLKFLKAILERIQIYF